MFLKNIVYVSAQLYKTLHPRPLFVQEYIHYLTNVVYLFPPPCGCC